MLAIGNASISNIQFGNIPVSEVWVGNKRIWTTTQGELELLENSYQFGNYYQGFIQIQKKARWNYAYIIVTVDAYANSIRNFNIEGVNRISLNGNMYVGKIQNFNKKPYTLSTQGAMGNYTISIFYTNKKLTEHSGSISQKYIFCIISPNTAIKGQLLAEAPVYNNNKIVVLSGDVEPNVTIKSSFKYV